MIKKWNNFWFTPSTPLNLGVTRALFFLFIFQYSLFFDQFSRTWSGLPSEFWEPVFLISFFEKPPLNPDQYLGLFYLFAGFCLLAGIGLASNITVKLTALLGTLLYAVRVSYTEGSHDNLVIVVFLWIFAFSRCGDGFSLDQKVKKSPGTKSGDYTWPIKLMWLMFGAVYFSAACSKIQNAGMAWIWGDTLKNYLLFSHYKTDLDTLGLKLGLAKWMAQFTLLCRVGGLFTVIIEGMTLFCSFSKRLRHIFIPLIFFWHVGFHFTSSNGFFNMIAIYFCWVNWEFVLSQLSFKKLNKAV